MLTIHPTAAGFLEQAQEALDRDEALHNLMIGVVARLLEQPDYYANQPAYLATWSAGGAPTYAAVMTPPYGLLVAAFTPGAPPPARSMRSSKACWRAGGPCRLSTGSARCPVSSPAPGVSALARG